MHPHDSSTVPTWLGFVFLALGLLILLRSPRLVDAQLAQIRRTNRWLLNLVGYDGEFLLSQRDDDPGTESGLDKCRRASYWFWTVIIGLIFVGFGGAILLKIKGISVGP